MFSVIIYRKCSPEVTWKSYSKLKLFKTPVELKGRCFLIVKLFIIGEP